MRWLAVATLVVALAITSCGETASPSPSSTNSVSKFPGGIYFVQPNLAHPGGDIRLLHGQLQTTLAFSGIGYDVRPGLAIFPTPDMSALIVTRPDGTTLSVTPSGLYRIGRPSLSADGTKVAVQASEDPMPASGTNPMTDTIYVVDIPQGTWHRVGDKPTPGDASTQNEQPAMFPSGDRVAFWAAPNQCLAVKVSSVSTGDNILSITNSGTTACYQPQRGVVDGPRFHVTVSPDSGQILIPGQMQIYDSTTGALLADIHKNVMDALSSAGFQPDSRFPGAGGGGTFPLSGSFSPDGKSIVFDGAVQKNGGYGEILCQIGVDGQGFTVLTDVIPAMPQFSNHFNFSQLLPHWR